MRLVLTQSGTVVTGTFESAITDSWTRGKPLPVSGTMDDVILHLQGGQPFVPPPSPLSCFSSYQVGFDIGDWTTTMNSGATSLTGVFRQSITGAYIFSCYVSTIDFQSEIVSLTRVVDKVGRTSDKDAPRRPLPGS